ncbi:hypothetical protein CCM_02027 [Cordyceps militaris CM01]|uniref:Uncharacterized protein n=1 Tax=Cordyceps militaris (strain CM01) TaxID=983644 RepID=G3JC93_CORMM|nr:uncharacterized protein CCM_02027 [Cordyceps militaris CM01]EGX93758.1 hypothetical protein CCM_02027 [Cordyceps militaris CM01]
MTDAGRPCCARLGFARLAEPGRDRVTSISCRPPLHLHIHLPPLFPLNYNSYPIHAFAKRQLLPPPLMPSMLATAPLAPSPTIMGSSTEHIYRALSDPLVPSPRQFKKHKTLPRPPNDIDLAPDATAPRATHDAYCLVLDTSTALSSSATQSYASAATQTLKPASRRFASSSSAGPDRPDRPDPPPTPPAHSRASPSGHPTLDPSPTAAQPARHYPPPPLALRKPPVTPPDQRSPPTPDVTPPQPQTALKSVRPPRCDQSPPGATPTDSRNDSFTTAREEQFSEDDHARAALRSRSTSAQTSQTTILATREMPAPVQVRPPAGATGSLPISPPQLTPRTMNEFRKFDGEWDSAQQLANDRRHEHQQDGSRPHVVISKRKRSTPKTPIITSPVANHEVLEDHVVTPTAATRAARYAHVRDNAVMEASPVSSSVRSISETSASVEARRSSATSARSSSSAVVEVLVMNGPAQPPQRRRTLRHVKKQPLLRQPLPVPDRSSGASFDGHRRLPQPQRNRHESPAPRDRSRPPNTQVTSNHAIGDSRARREILSSGSIPVIVVPDRRSSNRSKSREPSLRSTSSRRSKRSTSVGSHQQARGSLDTSRPESLSRGRIAGRTPGDERTMDFAPAIPPRSSSLSAPTSRNVSRTNSLTAESIRTHNALQRKEDEAKSIKSVKAVQPERHMGEAFPVLGSAIAPLSAARPSDAHLGRDIPLSPLLDPTEDGMSAKKYSSRNTPFSVTSVATTGTVPELSEALAVHMYQHQNSSVVVVNHSARPSDASNAAREALPQLVPTITTTGIQGEPPVTPPEQSKTEDVDSPLRNPRAPPEPPTHLPMLNLIPATPSGATPADESDKRLGNIFDPTPPRRESLLQRAFSRRRRNSLDYPPTSAKTPVFEADIDGELAPRKAKEQPVEREKLHPLWRPQYDDDDDECEYGDSCPHHSKRDTVYRYPLVDNRPRPPKRSLSARVKKTFAILPTRDDRQYPAEEGTSWPERRIIRRTPSGNLRVMQRRSSLDSMRMSPRLLSRQTKPSRLSTSTEQTRSFWPPGSLRRAETSHTGSSGRRSRRFSLSDTLEDIPNIPRMLTEKRREKRTQELRQMISAPTNVRDGVDEAVRRSDHLGNREPFKANPSDF